MAISSIAFILIFITANLYFAYRAKILVNLMLNSKGTPWNGNRFDKIGDRIFKVIENVLFQRAVLNKKIVGLLHSFIFFGFIIITIGTLESFIAEVFPGFTFEFLGPKLYAFLCFLQDTFHFLVLFAVLGFTYRRAVLKPKGLGKSFDANLILLITGSLMVSLIVKHSFEMISNPRWFDSYFWFSSFISSFISNLSISKETAHIIATTARWIHHFLVLGFLMYIPSSKHLHVLAAAPNIFFMTLTRNKAMKKINLEDSSESVSFGYKKINDLSWKDTLDLYACTECGRCQDACPAWNTEKPLSPKKLISDLKHTLIDNYKEIFNKDEEKIANIIGTEITEDVIWSCTSCRACEVECPVFIEHTDKIFEVRRNLVLMEGNFPAELQTVFKNLENNFSPWAMSPEDRAKWAEGLDVKIMSDVASQSSNEIEYLFWVGCAGSFDDRNKKVSQSLVKILNKAGVKFAILGNEEKCTGDPARRMGNEYLAQMLIQENVNTLNNYGIKKVITACPHCFNAIKNEWKDFGGNFEVIHHTQLIAELIKSGKIKPSKPINEEITYHDSCYIGRWNKEYDAPRFTLSQIPGLKLNEIPSANKEKGLCCGAGGGRMWMEEKIGTRINIKRTEQALSTNPKQIISNCPFCMTMLTDGVKAKEKTDSVQVTDIAEIVEKTL
jgi:Fe-S oxidoreductase